MIVEVRRTEIRISYLKLFLRASKATISESIERIYKPDLISIFIYFLSTENFKYYYYKSGTGKNFIVFSRSRYCSILIDYLWK